MADQFSVAVIRSTPVVLAESVLREPKTFGIDADAQGRVLFRETVSQNKFQEGLTNCIEMTRSMIDSASGISNNYEVDSIKLKLGLDSKFGLVFIGDAGLEASIEIEVKRVKS